MINCRHARYNNWLKIHTCAVAKQWHCLVKCNDKRECLARAPYSFNEGVCCPTCGTDMDEKVKTPDGSIFTCPNCQRSDEVTIPVKCTCGKKMWFVRKTEPVDGKTDYFVYGCECGNHIFRVLP